MWIEVSEEEAADLELVASYTMNRYDTASWQDGAQLESTKATASRLHLLYRKLHSLHGGKLFPENFNRVDLNNNDQDTVIQALVRLRTDFEESGNTEKAEHAENVLQKVLRFLA